MTNIFKGIAIIFFLSDSVAFEKLNTTGLFRVDISLYLKNTIIKPCEKLF